MFSQFLSVSLSLWATRGRGTLVPHCRDTRCGEDMEKDEHKDLMILTHTVENAVEGFVTIDANHQVVFLRRSRDLTRVMLMKRDPMELVKTGLLSPDIIVTSNRLRLFFFSHFLLGRDLYSIRCRDTNGALFFEAHIPGIPSSSRQAVSLRQVARI
jgi:hypothetical protein